MRAAHYRQKYKEGADDLPHGAEFSNFIGELSP